MKIYYVIISKKKLSRFFCVISLDWEIHPIDRYPWDRYPNQELKWQKLIKVLDPVMLCIMLTYQFCYVAVLNLRCMYFDIFEIFNRKKHFYYLDCYSVCQSHGTESYSRRCQMYTSQCFHTRRNLSGILNQGRTAYIQNKSYSLTGLYFIHKMIVHFKSHASELTAVGYNPAWNFV